ncbi:MAG TPA: hypothetical protein VE338_16915 [Ktedonobacterales bacterium]|jgi:hypothetical protein|nr:hypothetical protein [Ktedonobacterales bacterium]
MWFQVTAIILGLWLMVSPSILPATSTGAGLDRVAGPLVIWVGVLALRSVTRPFRALQIVSVPLLLIAPWFIPNTAALMWSTVLVGVALLALTPWRGRVAQHSGGGWLAVIFPARRFEVLPDPVR